MGGGADRGLIPAMPVAVDADTVMLLASALLVLTDWVERFEEDSRRPQAGPWRGGTWSACTAGHAI